MRILGLDDGKCLMCKERDENVSYSIMYCDVFWKILMGLCLWWGIIMIVFVKLFNFFNV